ncbi:unnamed protein product [Mycena citricolor]|uniref:Aip3p/Bud6 N-terminal domain-containing protein n=1 Tax=Mycena citricolor TaxID=2018698 RepID=A0AAD2H7R4_9AGAR|nr:unnamed protein product [Mycena citricolor]
MQDDGNPSVPAYRRSTSSSNTSDGSQGGHVFSPAMPGDVSTSVHNLLLATKQLQAVLEQWSVGRASETDVSDVYVQIGTDFNTAVQAFAYHRIDLSDIHCVPTELRTTLESCLAEDPSPEVLAASLPDLRTTLVKLLRGLLCRQQEWRRRTQQYPFLYR